MVTSSYKQYAITFGNYIDVIVQTIHCKKIITPSRTGTGRKTFFLIVALGGVHEKDPWAFVHELTYLDRNSFRTE